MRRVFTLTFMITLILFFTVFGICESYIAIQNTTSKDKITSVMEGFVDKEKGEIEIDGKIDSLTYSENGPRGGGENSFLANN